MTMNNLFGILAVTAVIYVCTAFPSPVSTRDHHTNKRSTSSSKPHSTRSTYQDFNNAYGLAETLMTYGDQNGNNELSEEEIQNFFRLSIGFPADKAEQIATAMIHRGDTDGDNALNFEETFVTMLYIFQDNS